MAAKQSSDWQPAIAPEGGRGVALPANFYRRRLLVARWTRALLQAGTIGSIRHFEVHEGLPFSWDRNTDRFYRPDWSSDGPLLEAGAHSLDLLLWWLGDFAAVVYQDDGEGGPASECVLDCELASGAHGRIEFSRTRALLNSIRIEGERGFVEVHLYKNEVLAASPNVLSFVADGIDPRRMRPQLAANLTGPAIGSVPAADVDKIGALIRRCHELRQPLQHPWTKPAAAFADECLARLPADSKVLVTGASGFVGGRLTEQLLHEHGAQVRCTVRDSGREARLHSLPVDLFPADLGNAPDVDRAIAGANYVFHCAFDIRAPGQNIEDLRHIIDACLKHSVRRLVYVSTFAVYEPFPDGSLSEATRDGDRANTYVDNKLALERMIFDAVRDHGLRATIVQPSIVYGPFCRPWTNTPAENLIYGEVVLPDSGDGLCNAVYIGDLVDGMLLAARSEKADGERFILSGPKPVTWATFFDRIAKALGTNRPVYWPYDRIVQAHQAKANGVWRTISSPKQLVRAIVRWKPARQIIRDLVDTLPDRLRLNVLRVYSASRAARTRETYVPGLQLLTLYRSKAYANSDKARTKLGYRPQFDFDRGMALTAPYLTWAYADTQKAIALKDAAATPSPAVSGSP
jgi:nucleoside-diphosphate-sugar epimerase